MESKTSAESPPTPSESEDSPPIDRPPVAKAAQSNPKPFPIPPKATMKGGYCDPKAGMDYWRSVPEEFNDRLTVYINREHPVLNRLQECDEADIELMRTKKKRYPIKYIDLPPERFSEDTDGEFLNRYGSGKYKVYVNDCGVRGTKEPDLQSRNLCRFVIKVYDSDFPPILDPSRADKGLGVLDWTHPDNQSYVAELRTRGIFPPDEKAGDEVAESVVSKLMDKVTDLENDRLVERIAERVGGNGNRTNDVVETIRAVRSLDAEKPKEEKPAEPVDPWAAAERILNMRTENPMMDIFKEQIKAQATAAEAERERNFKAAEAAREREFKLQEQLLAARNAPNQSKSLVDQALELVAVADKLEPLKKLFGFGSAAVSEAVGRVAKTTAYDIARDVFMSPFGQEVGAGLGSLLRDLGARGAAQNGNPAQPRAPIVLNAQQPNGTIPATEDLETRINRIGQMITQPMLYEFFLKDEPGDSFAATMFNMWPEDYAFMRGLGAENIVARYRRFGPAWALIAPKEPAFIQFITEFCKWDPNEDEGPTPPGDGDEGVVDLEAEGGN